MDLKAEIFSLLSPEDHAAVAEVLQKKELPAGALMFHEGDAGNELFIVERGKVRTSIRLPDGGEHELARFASGEIFGEMSLFENAPRSATCAALEPSRLWCLSRDGFRRLVALRPLAAIRLMYRMLNVTTRRLRATSGLVSDMVLWGEQARRRAITDELTGAYNRRFVEDSLEGIVADALTAGRPVSLYMADLDYFRQINESYGHAVGDEAIRAAIGVYRAVLGEKGLVARYGGDEFVVVLPGVDAAEALSLARRVCIGVASLDTLRDRGGRVTTVSTSIGVATCPDHAPDARLLRTKADAALYAAKEQGRNRAAIAAA
jgi:diguanylate cyclase (GGDEF)-like protein